MVLLYLRNSVCLNVFRGGGGGGGGVGEHVHDMGGGGGGGGGACMTGGGGLYWMTGLWWERVCGDGMGRGRG